MKKSMLILLLMFLMSACEDTENPQKIEENPPVQTTQETLAVNTLIIAETAVMRGKTTTKTTTVIDFENPAEFQSETKFFEETTTEIPEIQPKTESQPTVTVSENAKEKEPVFSEESAESAQTTAEISETQPKTESQATVTKIPDIPQKTDYDKALEVYIYMRENGSGTCVNYACQTYEMCKDVGLPCYIVWTNAGMYGHVANTVEIGGIWYILDAQGGYFLDYNYGFTEVVDIDGNHIADGDILSNYSYDELN